MLHAMHRTRICKRHGDGTTARQAAAVPQTLPRLSRLENSRQYGVRHCSARACCRHRGALAELRRQAVLLLLGIADGRLLAALLGFSLAHGVGCAGLGVTRELQEHARG